MSLGHSPCAADSVSVCVPLCVSLSVLLSILRLCCCLSVGVCRCRSVCVCVWLSVAVCVCDAVCVAVCVRLCWCVRRCVSVSVGVWRWMAVSVVCTQLSLLIVVSESLVFLSRSGRVCRLSREPGNVTTVCGSDLGGVGAYSPV